ncbi:MAG: hypothetical protein ACM4AI_09815 [Acidobacteriota bacterium]
MKAMRVRNLMFVTMLCATFAAMQARLLAQFDSPFTGWNGFCREWEDGDGYDCTDCPNLQGNPPDFYASGSCDFSGIEDEELRLSTASAYVQGSGAACDDTCDDDYRDYLIDWYQWTYPYHECYEAWGVPENWATWGDPGGSTGTNSTWSCACDYFFFGFCG